MFILCIFKNFTQAIYTSKLMSVLSRKGHGKYFICTTLATPMMDTSLLLFKQIIFHKLFTFLEFKQFARNRTRVLNYTNTRVNEQLFSYAKHWRTVSFFLIICLKSKSRKPFFCSYRNNAQIHTTSFLVGTKKSSALCIVDDEMCPVWHHAQFKSSVWT